MRVQAGWRSWSRIGLLGGICVALLGASSPPRRAPEKKPQRTTEFAGEGPLQFRCDNGEASAKSNRTLCIGNVIFRRGTILACCQRFEGVVDESGSLQQAVCTDDVRALRGSELMWAARAEYVAATSELTLLGKPLVRRGQSVIAGERVVARVDEEQVHIDKPRGQFVTDEQPVTALPVFDKIMSAKLPTKCPLPPPPRSRP